MRKSAGMKGEGACPLIPMEPEQVDSPVFREMAKNSNEWTVNVSARVRQLSKLLAQVKELEYNASVARKQMLTEFQAVYNSLTREPNGEREGDERALAEDVTVLTGALTGFADLRVNTEEMLQVKVNTHLQDYLQGSVQEALDAYKSYQKSCVQIDALMAKTTKSSKAQRTTADAEAESARNAHFVSAVASALRLNSVTVCVFHRHLHGMLL